MTTIYALHYFVSRARMCVYVCVYICVWVFGVQKGDCVVKWNNLYITHFSALLVLLQNVLWIIAPDLRVSVSS